MNNKLLVMILPLFLLFTSFVNADVPPDTGKVRVKIDLVTETTEDLTDYRFFLDFYGDLREVAINNRGRTTIPPMGGGARYSSGTFLAIPKKSLGGYEEKLSNEQLNNLSGSIKAKEIAGVVELAKHRFSADIPKGEKTPETHYLLKREENTLRAERVTEEKPKSNSSPQLIASDSRASLVIGGLLITLAVLTMGVFTFRKARKKV
jgi:hypothetical protein